MKIGFIGLGNMGTAMMGGIIKSGLADAKNVYGSDFYEESVKKAVDTYGISGMASNTEVVKAADIIIYSVKPQMYSDVLTETAGAVTGDKIIISIAPGKTVEWLMKYLPADTKLVRCMPNTPALVGEGCTGVCRNDNITDEDMKKVISILESFGKAYEVKESMMDAVVAVSGSSPAYVFMIIEAMADGAVMAGMPRNLAYEFAAQAVLGSAKMVLETGKHPGELKDMVCSPAGTTIEAVRVLEERGLRAAIIDCEKACVDKSKGM